MKKLAIKLLLSTLVLLGTNSIYSMQPTPGYGGWAQYPHVSYLVVSGSDIANAESEEQQVKAFKEAKDLIARLTREQLQEVGPMGDARTLITYFSSDPNLTESKKQNLTTLLTLINKKIGQ